MKTNNFVIFNVYVTKYIRIMKYSYILVLAVCKSLENKLKLYPKTLFTYCIITSNPLNT